MTAAVPYQIPLLPAGDTANLPCSKSSISHSNDGPDAKAKPSQCGKENKAIRRRRERPCDACRKRKSKCVANGGQDSVCAACGIHGQVCTYVEDPQPRKKRQENPGKNVESLKPRFANAKTRVGEDESPTIKREPESTMVFQGHALTRSPSVTPGGSPQHDGIHVGYTTELEPTLFDVYQAFGTAHNGTRYQRQDERNAFLLHGSNDDSHQDPLLSAFKSIEELIHPYGPLLIQRYRTAINPSLVGVENAFFSRCVTHPQGTLNPTLTAAIYSLTLATEEGRQLVSSSCLDIVKIEETAFRMFSASLGKPTISTVQAGILLMQIPHVDSRTLNTQLVSIAYDLGLHVDCSTWMLSDEEHSLRKRLAWAVFVQDKWCSLIHGRPSLISADHWAVPDLVEADYSIAMGDDRGELDVGTIRHGQNLFGQMVALTQILATVLDTFYTLKAMQEVSDAQENGTQLILERAKPVQIKLKNWFTQLPPSLKIESNAPGFSSSGYLHLAYFATEITLHRCIIRSLKFNGGEIYLSHVCRSAAKTRLISAMDFMNRLRPEHLTSFWNFPSAVNFALVGTFGSLLLATAPAQEEADFYRTRLAEYRWTLDVSSRSAEFLHFAIDSLDSSSHLLQNLPLKPFTAELAAKRPPLSTGRLSPPVDEHVADAPLVMDLGTFPAFPNQLDVMHALESGRPVHSGLISPSTSTSSNSTCQSGKAGNIRNIAHEELPGRGQGKRVRLSTDHWA